MFMNLKKASNVKFKLYFLICRHLASGCLQYSENCTQEKNNEINMKSYKISVQIIITIKMNILRRKNGSL